MLEHLKHVVAGFFALGIFVVVILQSICLVWLEYSRDMQNLQDRLALNAQRAVQTLIVGNNTTPDELTVDEQFLSATDRMHSRIFDKNGEALHVGLLFQQEPLGVQEESWIIEFNEDHYRVFTFPIFIDGENQGSIQIAEKYRSFKERLEDMTFLILVFAAVVASIKFWLAMLFQSYALRPVKSNLSAMAQFTENAGHELKTPLANLQSSLDVALKTGEYKEGIEEAKADIKTMSALIDTLLHLETLQVSDVQKQPTDVSQLVTDVAKSFEAKMAEKNIELITKITPGVVRLADAHLIRDVLNNLLQNAYKFTDTGGKIGISVSHKKIRVKDTGIGMAPEIAAKIFDRFFKADVSRTERGFGLGLALVAKIVHLHGWNIRVDSKPGKGSEFTIIYRKK